LGGIGSSPRSLPRLLAFGARTGVVVPVRLPAPRRCVDLCGPRPVRPRSGADRAARGRTRCFRGGLLSRVNHPARRQGGPRPGLRRLATAASDLDCRTRVPPRRQNRAPRQDGSCPSLSRCVISRKRTAPLTRDFPHRILYDRPPGPPCRRLVRAVFNPRRASPPCAPRLRRRGLRAVRHGSATAGEIPTALAPQ